MTKQNLSIFVKISIFTALFFLFAIESKSQSISIFDIDTSAFPIMKAKIYAFDKDGKQQRPSASELKLSENGIDRKILSVTCPNPKPVKAISSVLVMDVSGSMANGSSAGITKIDLAKQASTSWINALPTASSQCAITSFDGSNYFIQDFTTDRSKLLSAINTLTPSGETNYDAALYSPMAGGIPIAKSGKYKKVVIIITDGLPNQEPQVQTIINEANNNGIMIFAVTLEMPCPDNLKNITTQTGGFWYENVTTFDNARQIYYTIMNNVNNGEPCEITWESDVTCSNRINFVELQYNTLQYNTLQYNTLKYSTSYESSKKSIASLKVKPNFISFGKPIASKQYDTTITISAQNTDFTINGINRKFGSSDFTVINTSFPLFIAKNTSKNITLRFVPSDSSIKYESFVIETDKCLAYFSANALFPGKKANNSTLKLTHPNGGESFVVGSDTIITWSGISSSDSVSLEFSINNGKSWKKLTKNATNLKYNWKSIKPPSSLECKIRVKLNNSNMIPDTSNILTLIGHHDIVNGIDFNYNGSKVATASADFSAKIWDAYTGSEIKTLLGHKNRLVKINFSPNGNQIVTASWDGTIKIWDTFSGNEIRTISIQRAVTDVEYSPDGKFIATSDDSTARIWDANSGLLIKSFIDIEPYFNDITYNYDGSNIATADKYGTAKIWDVQSGKLLKTMFGHKLPIFGISFSPDGSQIATASVDNTAKLWDVKTGALIRNFSEPNSLSSVAFSPDGNKLATSGWASKVNIWDANKGVILLNSNKYYDAVYDLAFSPDGSRIAFACMDSSARIWQFEPDILQEDQSDAVFSIVAPEVQSKDIDMKKCLVASSKDSVISNFIENIGSYKCRIDSIYFRGADASAFSLVSGFPQYIVDVSQKHNIELRFKPSRVGFHDAEIVIITQADTLIQKITGEGIQPSLAIINKYIDFGKVYVGDKKDTLQAMTIKNIGISTINISDVKFLAPNDKDFSMISGSKSFTLGVGDTAKMDLRFSANSVGHQSGFLSFEYNNGASSSQVQLYAEGIDHGPKIQSEILGITDLKCEESKLDSIKILNQGDLDLKLDDAKLSGANSDEFQLIDNIAGIIIPANKDYFLKYLFKPKSDGNKIAELNIKSNSLDDKDLYLQLEANSIGKYQLFTNAKVFLKGKIGAIAKGLIKLENNYDFDITITDSSNIDPFYFENLTLPLVIKSKESKEIAVRFKAIDRNIFEKNVELTSEPCNVKSNLILNYGSIYSKANLFTDTIQAYPGDIIAIPIMLKNAEDLESSNSKTFKVNLTFNSTLLEPIGNTPTGILNNDNTRTVELDLPTKADESGLLAKFQFKVGLGNDSTTKLILSNPSADAGDVDLQVESGVFNLLGICRAAGPRLINPNGEVKLSLIRPNPVGDNGELDIETIENGQTELYIINLKGEKVATLYQGELAAGKQTLIISTKDLSNGTYFVILQTPTVTQKVKMEVVK